MHKKLDGCKIKSVLSEDIVASTFVLLTCYEEFVTSGRLDTRNRRLACDSMLGRYGLLKRPLVCEYAVLLKEKLRQLKPDLFFSIPDWKGYKFAFTITRDIDSLWKYPRLSVKLLTLKFLSGHIADCWFTLKMNWRKTESDSDDPHHNLMQIFNWEKEHQIRSSIYFMSSNLAGDANYQLSDVTRDLAYVKLVQGDWEIGFHPGYRTFHDEVAFNEEYERFLSAGLPHPCGGRQHGLRVQPPYTWRFWENRRFTYEASIGFAEQDGFKSGICFPYRTFDLLENRVMDLWELPITVMDCTLDRYRGLSLPEIRSTLDDLLSFVQNQHGVFVLLWHNTYFGRGNVGGYHDELVRLVEQAMKEGAYVGRAKDIINAWEDYLQSI